MNNLDYLIFLIVLLLPFGISYVSSKKIKNADDYLMAGRNLNKVQAGFSLAATSIGGSAIVAGIGVCYSEGFGGIWWNLAAAPAFIFVAYVLAKKMHELRFNTVPHYLGKRYTNSCKLMATNMHIIALMISLSSQFIVAATVLNTVSGINMGVSIAIMLFMTLILTVMGGLRSVVNTDATFFVVIIISVIACLVTILNAGHGLDNIAANVPNGFTSIWSIGYTKPIAWLFLNIFASSCSQIYVQRMISSNNDNTAKFSALFTAGTYIVIAPMLGIIGIGAAVIMPGIQDSNIIFPQLIVDLFPMGLKGLSVAGVFAATVSTATTLLHSIVTLFMSDIWPELKVSQKSNSDLLVSRVSTVIVIGISYLISLVSNNIIDMIYFAGLFYNASVFFPLLMGMNSKKITAASGTWSIIGAVMLGLIWELFIKNSLMWISSLPSNVMAALFGLILLLVISKKDISA